MSSAVLAPKRKTYSYQQTDIQTLLSKIETASHGSRLLYQLPTGGGKTVIFSEIAKYYIQKYSRQVVVLTHRIELCRQTTSILKKSGINSQAYTSDVKRKSRVQPDCYVAMIETLKNRIRDKVFNPDAVGLVIIDEAHHNSFQKLLDKFKNAIVIGVTATPLSSDITMPLHKNYSELIVGEAIQSLIAQGYLAKPKAYKYTVELNSLVTAPHGDYTVASSDLLYASDPMLELLHTAYKSHCQGKKTLIFNNGIFTSKRVFQMFSNAGYPVRHLDNKTPKEERTAILKWFKETKDAILTSVSILTTGFDEPSVQAVILYRATNSLTLYHQMVGRGSRRTGNKKTFTIVDLGNNIERFGEWDAPLDWKLVFENPEGFINKESKGSDYESHSISSELRSKFPKTLELSFDIESAYLAALQNNEKPKTVIRDAIRQHALMCIENAETITEALHLSDELESEIAWRVRQYCKCLENTTKNYSSWLQQDYRSKLRTIIQKLMHRIITA
ncbi:DEAD/DEAH box helicase [Flavobacterium sp. DG1-102-2]|uniref:DEAD/DEAH box helicase n=1 Tax=Flavobacterium sp. DG1-102-2 TaxID=3081663 RepID=UPI00294A8D5C|nr:DEAD/DEAH box helicase [Flavobacterium sp. DG1-102-2]MDV6167153.1 DEAD/DEAH box helicase [Flavobacterium sp. DG1-102-2]